MRFHLGNEAAPVTRPLDCGPGGGQVTREVTEVPLYLFFVLLQMLSVFTSIGDDLPDVLGSYSIVHATMTGIDPEKRQKLLQDSYALCDNLKEEWDNSGLLNKQGFLTKRGGNIKVLSLKDKPVSLLTPPHSHLWYNRSGFVYRPGEIEISVANRSPPLRELLARSFCCPGAMTQERQSRAQKNCSIL